MSHQQKSLLIVKIRSQIIIAIFSTLCLCPALLYSQNIDIQYEHLGIEEGLSQVHVSCIIQDSKGFMWFGTDDGLNKYDGYSLSVYRHDINDSTSISNNYITAVCQDLHGNLWIGTRYGNLDMLDRKTDKFSGYQIPIWDPDNSETDWITEIFGDERSDLWIKLKDGKIIKFNIATKRFSAVQALPDGLDDQFKPVSDDPVWSIIDDSWGKLTFYRDASGILWIGTNNGIKKVDSKTEQFVRYRSLADNSNSLSHNYVWSIFENISGDLWIGTRDGLNKYERDSQEFTRYLYPPIGSIKFKSNFIQSIFEDSQANLWIGTQTGLIKQDKETSKFIRYLPEKDVPESGKNLIKLIFEDSHNNLWVGTGKGLNTFDRETEQFTSFLHHENDPQSISSNRVTSLYEDTRGDLWVGTDDTGINRFDFETRDFTRFSFLADNPKSINNNSVKTISEDASGNLWIGTREGLNKLNIRNGGYTLFTENDGLPNNLVYGILPDSKGNLWLSTNKGLSKFDPLNETFTNYTEKDGLQSNEFNTGAYHKGKSGRMYFGGVNGYNEFYPDSIKDNTFIPPVVITDFLLFNKSVNISDTTVLKQHINYVQDITLNYNDYIFSIEFSTLNYRQSEKNKFAYKLEGFNEDWIETDFKNRRATYTNLSPGEYTFRVRAANDDGYWNNEGATLDVKILPPWWATWWAEICFAVTGIFIVIGVISLRTRSLNTRRKELESIVTERTATIVEQKEEIESALETLKRTQSQLIQSEKMASLGQLTAGIAHEINNPLNFIQSGTIALSRDVEDLKRLLAIYKEAQFKGGISSDEILAFENEIDLESLNSALKIEIDGIIEGTRRTSNIVKGLNDFSHENQLEMEAADIHHGIDVTLNLLTSRLTKDIEIIKNYDESIGEIDCNIGQLNQVFLNLFLNALDAVDGKGQIEVSTKKADGQVRIAIKDNGIGISKENLNRIFDPFFTTKDVGKGTGLGLSISHGIIENHGGKIEVESEVGKGTKFVIVLPSE